MEGFKDFYTIKNSIESLTVIERSKFICFLKSCENEEEIKIFIDSIRKQHSLATHNCYAYIADEKGLIQKFSDDGEPQGTAGMPMLEILRSKNLYKTVAVVTRYFGGVKLGTGGLVRAYQGAVLDGLNKATIECQKYSLVGDIKTDYNGLAKVIKIASTIGAKILNTDFTDGIRVEFAVNIDDYDRFKKDLINATNGKIEILEKDNKYMAF